MSKPETFDLSTEGFNYDEVIAGDSKSNTKNVPAPSSAGEKRVVKEVTKTISKIKKDPEKVKRQQDKLV
jgi:hypothetical protein